MELWVRNQTKTGLYKIDNVYIHEDEDKTIHIWTDGINKYLKYYLGGYKSKERALEILDEIQDLLKPIYNLQYKGILSKNDLRKFQKMNEGYITNDNSTEIKPLNNNVLIYEMPEE